MDWTQLWWEQYIITPIITKCAFLEYVNSLWEGRDLAWSKNLEQIHSTELKNIKYQDTKEKALSRLVPALFADLKGEGIWYCKLWRRILKCNSVIFVWLKNLLHNILDSYLINSKGWKDILAGFFSGQKYLHLGEKY